MKRIMAAFTMVIAVLGITFSSMAMEQLPAPSWVRWEYIPEEGGLIASFEEVDKAEGEYDIEILKDGEYFYFTNWYDLLSGNICVSRLIFEDGTYTFRIKAKGDNIQTADSQWSLLSEPYVYTKPEKVLGMVQNVRWSSEKAGTVEWEVPLNVDESNKDLITYSVIMYKNGKPGRNYHRLKTTYCDLLKGMTEDAEYTFSVRAVSSDIEHITHGPEVMCETPFSGIENNSQVLDRLQEINSEINKSEASPSDAERALENMNMEEMAIAVQSNEKSLQTMKDIEERYLDLTGKHVEKHVDHGVDIDPEQISLVGAGLNIASTSNAIRINIGKPDKEADIDSRIYKNIIQFDINAMDSVKPLRAPITIIMPIPENVKSSRLRILHFHNDGTYELILPAFTEDGRIRFTATSFSIFAFVEDVDQNEKPADNTTSGGNRHYSSSSGGSRSMNSQSGTWVQSEKGWWFKENDGSWPANQWRQLMWNGTQQWYFFDQDGYMKTGWLDWNGKRYYLHTISDGTMGHMYMGWRQIDGVWYYFDLEGALMVNAITPDGFRTDENGAWIE